MRMFAWLLAAGVLSPAALAFPSQDGQEKKDEKQEKKDDPKKDAVPPPGGDPQAPDPKMLEELGALADGLTAAKLDDEMTADVLLAETRGRMMRRMRGPGGDAPPPAAGAGEGRPEPLGAFAKARIAEGKKGPDLAAAIKAEIEKRRTAAGAAAGGGQGPGAGEGRGPGGGFGMGGERMKAMRDATVATVKKLRAEKVAGKAFAEAFVKEQRAQMEKFRQGRREGEGGTDKEKPPKGEKPEKSPGL